MAFQEVVPTLLEWAADCGPLFRQRFIVGMHLPKCWLAVAAFAGATRADPLPRLPIDRAGITVAGFGYGGDMAVQSHIAFSASLSGVCAFAAQPFYCAVTRFTREPTVAQSADGGVPRCDGCPRRGRANETLPFDHCRASPQAVDVGKLPDYPRRHCGEPPRAGCLDDIFNVSGARAYLQVGPSRLALRGASVFRAASLSSLSRRCVRRCSLIRRGAHTERHARHAYAARGRREHGRAVRRAAPRAGRAAALRRGAAARPRGAII